MSTDVQSVETLAAASRLNGRQILLDSGAGLLSGVMRVLGAVSIATLLFPGRLSEFFLVGVAIGVLTVIAGNLVAGVRNTIPYVTYATDYTPIFLYSVVGTALYSALPASQFVPTLASFIIASSVTTGGMFFLVGHFRLSNTARFVPFPVVAGFMAGIGLEIVLQSMGNLARVSPTWKSFPQFFTTNAVLHWLPGVAFALIMMFGGRIIRTKFFPQIVILLTIGLFLAILALTNTSIEVARANGWSATPLSGNLPSQFYLASIGSEGSPADLIPHLNIFATVIGVSLLSVLITLSGLEVSTRTEMDFERELKDAGLANIVSGLIGGAITYQSVSNSMMNYKMGGRSRLVPFVTGFVALGFLVFGWGAGAIRYMPIALVAGLVLYVGLDFVQVWLFESRRRMSSIEYALLVAIACTVVVWGVIIGVTLGIVVAALLFTITYTRLPCIYLRQTGKSLRSKVERPATQEAMLAKYDDQVRLFRLQGYLFFGSAEKIAETVKRELKEFLPGPDVPLSVILDFQSVSGIDSSAAMAFVKIFEMARARGARIMLINLGDRIEAIFRRCVGADAMTDIRFFADRDVALEARERSILDRANKSDPASHTTLDVLSRLRLDTGEIGDLIGFFEPQDVKAGEVVFRQGEKADSMLIVDSGEFEVFLQAPDGGIIRIRKVIAGATLGEMGIYLEHPRATSVRATTDGRVMVLDRKALTRMHTERAALALKFNRFIIGVLADRLALSNGEILELSSPNPQ